MIRESKARLKIAVLSLDAPNSPCALIRLIYPLSYLRSEVELLWASNYMGDSLKINLQVLKAADIIIIQRFFICDGTYSLIQQLLSSGTPVVYETDDLLIRLPKSHPLNNYIKQNRKLLVEVMSRVDSITVSTKILAEYLSKYNRNIYLLPNMINKNIWKTKRERIHKNTLVIGYCGTPTHHDDLKLIEKALTRISNKYQGKISYTFIGCKTEKISLLPKFNYIDYSQRYDNFARVLSSQDIDIALAPLSSTAFNRCKSNIKWLEYSICGIAGVYSNLPPYTSVKNGETGLLTKNDAESWYRAIDYLINNPDARLKIGEQSCNEVNALYTLDSRATCYLDAYHKILQK